MSEKELESKKKKAAHLRAVFFDKLAKYGIYAGGIAVIIAITGILAFIVVEAYPLLSGRRTIVANGCTSSSIRVRPRWCSYPLTLLPQRSEI